MSEYHALYFHLGPYGRQDIHLHPQVDPPDASEVLVAFGRDCEPKGLHVRKKLTVGAAWSRRDAEGQPLAGPVGKEPRKVEPT